MTDLLPSQPERFRDRIEAGRVLAGLLTHHVGRADAIVLALPRGGVPIGFEVAKALGAPLDVFLVRKLGVPGHEELAMGAIATGGVRLVNAQVVEAFGISDAVLDEVAGREREELRRRERTYRDAKPPPDVAGKVAILVDDGLATGSTMRAAVAALRLLEPARIVVAVPVAARATCDEFGPLVDEVICARMPDPFHAVGLWYGDFTQTTDADVRAILDLAKG